MAELPLRIDYALAMAPGVGEGRGLTDAQLDEAAPAVEAAVDGLLTRVRDGELGFFHLPRDRRPLEAVDRWVAGLDPAIEDVLVLGIGGSSLGARAIHQALGGPPELARAAPGRRRLHFPDNSDPWQLVALLEHLAPERTLAVVTSKSGGTVETAAQYLVVREWLAKDLGADTARKHLVLVTDPEKGPLRDLARGEHIDAFDIPPNVGGRFSVLTPVGLLPARLAGVDARGLLDGAAAVAEACERRALRENPAALLAALHVLHHRRFGHAIHVLMPYADALRPFAAWFVQLWAESLGKRHDRAGAQVENGPTPLPAVGATDQHAQVQLFMEGPRDKLVTFVAVDEPAHDLPIPTSTGPFAYLGGHTLGGLLDAERRGTTLALAEDGRPSLTVHLPRVDARTLGALFFLYEAATALAGELYDVNAFDQPGVELGKRLASGLLGKPGHEDAAAQVRDAEGRLPERYRLGWTSQVGDASESG
ncbi:MAG: glucose-6-phosphate isomerase [Myxococcota bacterium]